MADRSLHTGSTGPSVAAATSPSAEIGGATPLARIGASALYHIGAINLAGAWADYRGAGVDVGIVDDGVNHAHVDLRANYDRAGDYDARDGDDEAQAEDGDFHGTMVAGVLGAANNASGTLGVAHGAAIAGFRVGFGAHGSLEQMDDALGRAVAQSDVVNNSWSYTGSFTDNFKYSYFANATQILRSAAADGRDGMGTIVVFAAGNSRSSGDNVNYHNFQNSP